MRKTGEAWHLPGLERGLSPDPHEGRTRGGLGVRTPRLDRREAERVAGTVRGAALRARRARSTREVAAAASRAALRLADPETEAGRQAVDLLRRELGWTEDLARETLSGMAGSWSGDALLSLLETELGSPEILDGFVEAPPPGPGAGRSADRRRHAAGPPLLHVVHAGNVPGIAVTAALRGLLVRSGVLCKAPRDEPGLLALFARELAREDRLLGRSLATTWWPGDRRAPPAEAWAGSAGITVVYGGEAAVRALRSRVPPDADLVVYGPKLGVGAVLADVAEGPDERLRRAAEGLAADVWAYEQAGCVSPRVVYVVGGARRFARALADALEDAAARHPPPPPEPGDAVALRALRAGAEFRGYAGSDALVLADEDGLAWTVLVGGEPEPVSEGLPRVVRLHGVGSVREIEAALESAEGRLQSLGYAGDEGRGRLAEAAARLGVCRMAPFGSVAWPPPDWRHDGRHQLLPLVRWTDLEV